MSLLRVLDKIVSSEVVYTHKLWQAGKRLVGGSIPPVGTFLISLLTMRRATLITFITLMMIFVYWSVKFYGLKYFFVHSIEAENSFKSSQFYPQYGHAPDYSWVTGKLGVYTLEGGCTTLTFSETQRDEGNYFGIFALELSQAKKVPEFDLKNGIFVVVTGKIKGQKFSMACPQNIYQVDGIISNEQELIFPSSPLSSTKRVEIKPNGKGQTKKKLVPPVFQSFNRVSPGQAADKIVTHGFNLLDAYIKELPSFTCVFPDGQFAFTLNDDSNINLAPTCANDKVWRQIIFKLPDGKTQATILDGPITGESGVANPEAILKAKKTLESLLVASNMGVKRIFNENVSLDLSSQNDFQLFIVDLLFGSIRLNKPLSSGPIPSQHVVPSTIQIKVNPNIEKPIKVAGISTSSNQVKTDVAFGLVVNEIKINVNQEKKETQLEVSGATVISKRDLEIQTSKLYLETSSGIKEIKKSPAEAYKFLGLDKAQEIILGEENQTPTYFVKGLKQGKLLFIFPVEMKKEAKVNAETGSIISVKAPWWDLLVK